MPAPIAPPAEHRRERARGMTVGRRADVPLELVLRAIERHVALVGGSAGLAGDALIKDDGRARVSVVSLGDTRLSGRVCVKEFVRPRLRQRLGDLVRGSRARLAWAGARGCLERGIATPAPLAFADAAGRSFFLTAFVEGAVPLTEYVADHARPAGAGARRRWRGFIRQAAELVRALHACELRHLDLSGKNVLVREGDGCCELFLVDVSDVRVGRAPSLALQLKNLGQLGDLWISPSRTDRLRFFRCYARGRMELAPRDLPAQIEALSRARHAVWLACGGRELLAERRRQGKPA